MSPSQPLGKPGVGKGRLVNSHITHPIRPGRGLEDEQLREPATRPSVRIVTSESLFRGTFEIGIEHHGSLYRLKITRQGKLILNK